MPRSTSGKWVARAGATGGGRTYHGQIPTNWYLALVLIVIVGIGSVVYARSEYRSAAAADTVPPTKGTTWYVAFDFDICGTQREPVTANETDPTKQSFYTTGDGVIVVSPKKTTVAGTHAVLAKFVGGYAGMGVTTTSVTVPPSASKAVSTTTTTLPATTTTTTTGATTAAATTTTTGATTAATTTTTAAAATTTTTAVASTTTTAKAAGATSGGAGTQLDAKTSKKDSTTTTKAGSTTTKATSTTSTTVAPTTTTTAVPGKTYTNGMTCAKGTKDAGKKADVMVTYWGNAFAAKEKPSTVTGDPGTLLFSSNQEITIGFVPPGTTLPKPTGTVVTALLKASTGASVSSSTTVTTTTAAGTTSSTTGATTTTAAGTTSTTAPVTTTTAAPVTTTTAAATTTTATPKAKKKK